MCVQAARRLELIDSPDEAAELAAMCAWLEREMSRDDAAAATDYELARRIANQRRARRGLVGPASAAEIERVLETM